jgi:hypothetical protein
MDKLKELISRKPSRWGNLTIKEFEHDITMLQDACKYLVIRDEYVEQLQQDNEHYQMKYENTGGIFNKQRMLSQIEQLQQENRTLTEQLDISHHLHKKEFDKVRLLESENERLQKSVDGLSDTNVRFFKEKERYRETLERIANPPYK